MHVRTTLEVAGSAPQSADRKAYPSWKRAGHTLRLTNQPIGALRTDLRFKVRKNQRKKDTE
jgi:hypothetical protein